MFKRVILAGMGLMAVGMGPAAYFSAPGYWTAVRDEWFPAKEAAGAAGTEDIASGGAPAPSDPALAARPTPSLAEAPVYDLAEVLSFDVTMNWVLSRWPRVSTGLAHLQYQGYRVPLVTGTAASDLAGSLTYYFDPQQQVQRITLHGTTGDVRELLTLLTTRHQFKRRPANNPGLFIYEAVHSYGRRKSVLEITSAGVVQSNDPFRRFKVDLVMERP